MRIGFNPNKDKEIGILKKSHRVIIPVYIPNFDGYFKDTLNVFKVCIDSLLKTINSDTAISIISNASCSEVNDYIYNLLKNNKIDRAIFNTENVGKMNAIMSETRASFEEFITYSDADVFFDKGWLFQTYKMFENVPKAGFISMNPTPNHYGHSETTLLYNLSTLFSNKKTTKDVCSFEDLEHFHKSIGRGHDFTKNMYKKNILTITDNNYILGAGHFCCTIRKTPTLKHVPLNYSFKGVSGGSETIYLDKPFNKTSLLRLSSPKSYVWHMGNVLENNWANEKIIRLTNFREKEFSFNDLQLKKGHNFLINLMPYNLKVKLIRAFRKFKIIKL